VLQLGLGLWTGNGYFFFFKVTNTSVLPSWADDTVYYLTMLLYIEPRNLIILDTPYTCHLYTAI